MTAHRMKVHAIQLLAIAVVLSIWEIASSVGNLAGLLPSPASAAAEVGSLLTSGSFGSQALVTLAEFLSAAAIGIVVALAVGIATHRRAQRLFEPLTQLALSTPQSVFLPVFMFIFGIGFVQKLVVGTSHVLFVVMLNGRAAANSVPSELITTGRYYGAKRTVLFRRVYVPYMLPALVQAVRLGVVFALTGVLVAELYVSDRGIGTLVTTWSSQSNIRALVAVCIIIAATSILISQVLFAIERRLSAWRS